MYSKLFCATQLIIDEILPIDYNCLSYSLANTKVIHCVYMSLYVMTKITIHFRTIFFIILLQEL